MLFQNLKFFSIMVTMITHKTSLVDAVWLDFFLSKKRVLIMFFTSQIYEIRTCVEWMGIKIRTGGVPSLVCHIIMTHVTTHDPSPTTFAASSIVNVGFD